MILVFRSNWCQVRPQIVGVISEANCFQAVVSISRPIPIPQSSPSIRQSCNSIKSAAVPSTPGNISSGTTLRLAGKKDDFRSCLLLAVGNGC